MSGSIVARASFCVTLLIIIATMASAVGECSTCQTRGYDEQHVCASGANMSANQGGVAWSYVVEGAWLAAAPAIDDQWRVIRGDSSAELFCLDGLDGQLIWRSSSP